MISQPRVYGIASSHATCLLDPTHPCMAQQIGIDELEPAVRGS